MERHTQERTFPHVTHSKAANILACELRGETHESLACLAANLTVERDDLLAALRDILEGKSFDMQPRGSWSYADIIQKHYQIARAALARAVQS